MHSCVFLVIACLATPLIFLAAFYLPPLIIKVIIESYISMDEYSQVHAIPDDVNATDGQRVVASTFSFELSITIAGVLLIAVWALYCKRLKRDVVEQCGDVDGQCCDPEKQNVESSSDDESDSDYKAI